MFLIYSYLISRIITQIRIRYYSFIAYLLFISKGVRVGKNLRVTGPIDFYIHWKAKLQIGDNCWINSGFLENPVGGFRKTGLYVGPDGVLIIGNDVGISNSTIVCVNSILIEDHVFIGGDSNIYDTDFHSQNKVLRGTLNDKGDTSAIIFMRNCFIGGHCLILKGVVIGEGAIVGAQSVVTKSIGANQLWAGNPARFVKGIPIE